MIGPVADVDVGREEERDAVRRELLDPAYDAAQPPLLYRVVGRAVRFVLEQLDKASASVPGGRTGLLLLLLLLVATVAVLLVRLRPSRRAGADGDLFGGTRTLTAADHRALADQAAAQGRWADAVRERLRAVVRELEARGVLDARPGRTAGEVAREGGAAVPAIAGPLQRAATTFDEVWYGGRVAGPASYAVVVELDDAVRTTRLVSA